MPIISQARSLAAEWALVNEQAAQNKLTATYASAMRASIRKELQQSAKALTRPDSPYGVDIQALLREPDDAAPDALRSRADTLKRIEDDLESA